MGFPWICLLTHIQVLRPVGQWREAVIDAAPGGPDAVRAEPITAGAAGVDIRPLVEHIAKLEDRIQSLTEAATVWQIRAVNLEEQLKQLTAGPGAIVPTDDAEGFAVMNSRQQTDESPQSDDVAPSATEAADPSG